MSTNDGNVGDQPPTDINPYEVLGIEPDASADDIKSAYRKQALKHHPGIPSTSPYTKPLPITDILLRHLDKAPPSAKETAHTKFQAIAFAYAILSSPTRRRRYDATGNTSESLLDDDSDFDWAIFYREQFADVITGSTLDKFKANYISSGEERRDVLAGYISSKGNMNAVYRSVMLSNPLDDEERYREMIDAAIAEGEVESYKAYTEEKSAKKSRRMEMARREGKDAKEYAKELGVEEKLFGNGAGKKGGKRGGDEGLAALIQQRQKGRAEEFFDKLEAKYAGAQDEEGGGARSKSKLKKGKKRTAETEVDEAPEEALQKTAERAGKNKKARGSSKSAGEGKGKAYAESNGTRRSKRAKK